MGVGAGGAKRGPADGAAGGAGAGAGGAGTDDAAGGVAAGDGVAGEAAGGAEGGELGVVSGPAGCGSPRAWDAESRSAPRRPTLHVGDVFIVVLIRITVPSRDRCRCRLPAGVTAVTDIVPWHLTLHAHAAHPLGTGHRDSRVRERVRPPRVPIFASAEARAIVDAPDRSPSDCALDAGRRPAELLTFLHVAPGMRVGELVAGGGYTAELLARAVAPNGVVYAENPRVILQGSGDALAARLSTPAAKNIVRIDRELEDPFPPEARDLNLVVINLVYHDTVWLGVDRDKMNRAVFAALRTGGHYAVLDHSARPGTGIADVQTLHRIDEAFVRDEVQRAGFVLEGKDSFLRNPSDMRDWNDSPTAAAERRGTSDRFALMFARP